MMDEKRLVALADRLYHLLRVARAAERVCWSSDYHADERPLMRDLCDAVHEALDDLHFELRQLARELESPRDLDADDAPVRRARSLHLR